jgi:hypothetical protein
MQIVVRNALDAEQSRILLSAYEMAWRRLIEAGVLTRLEHAKAQNILLSYLRWLVRRGERNEARVATRGVFLICGLLACPDDVYVPGRPMQANGTQIVF